MAYSQVQPFQRLLDRLPHRAFSQPARRIGQGFADAPEGSSGTGFKYTAWALTSGHIGRVA